MKILSVLLVGLGASACCKAPTQTSIAPLAPVEAERIVQEFAMKIGVGQSDPGKPPTSLEEVNTIIEQDQVFRFKGAIEFLAQSTGFDALVKRATLELLHAEMQLGVAYFLDERAGAMNVQISQLEKPNKGGFGLAEEETVRLDELRGEVRELGRVAQALRELAAPHTAAGASLAEEAIRRQPGRPQGYRNAAFAFALTEEWREFDKMMEQARKLGAEQDFAIRYLSGIESIRRFANRKDSRGFLEGLATEFPGYVRVQARLLFLYDDIESTYQQLQLLRSLSPNHPIVRLVGDKIEGAYHSAKELAAQSASGQAHSD